MEQDRASALFIHYPELARQAACQSRSDRQSHRVHDYRIRVGVHAEIDASEYPLGKKVTDEELAGVNIQRQDVLQGMELHYSTIKK